MSADSGSTQKKSFVITRFDPDKDEVPKTQEYEIPVQPDWKVLAARLVGSNDNIGATVVKAQGQSGSRWGAGNRYYRVPLGAGDQHETALKYPLIGIAVQEIDTGTQCRIGRIEYRPRARCDPRGKGVEPLLAVDHAVDDSSPATGKALTGHVYALTFRGFASVEGWANARRRVAK